MANVTRVMSYWENDDTHELMINLESLEWSYEAC